MKKILRNICWVATGLNIGIMLLATVMNSLDLLLLGGTSGLLTLFGALYLYTEEKDEY